MTVIAHDPKNVIQMTLQVEDGKSEIVEAFAFMRGSMIYKIAQEKMKQPMTAIQLKCLGTCYPVPCRKFFDYAASDMLVFG